MIQSERFVGNCKIFSKSIKEDNLGSKELSHGAIVACAKNRGVKEWHEEKLSKGSK